MSGSAARAPLHAWSGRGALGAPACLLQTWPRAPWGLGCPCRPPAPGSSRSLWQFSRVAPRSPQLPRLNPYGHGMSQHLAASPQQSLCQRRVQSLRLCPPCPWADVSRVLPDGSHYSSQPLPAVTSRDSSHNPATVASPRVCDALSKLRLTVHSSILKYIFNNEKIQFMEVEQKIDYEQLALVLDGINFP